MICKICKGYYKNSYDDNHENIRGDLTLIILRHIQETTNRKKIKKAVKLLNIICTDCLNMIHHKAYDLITEEINDSYNLHE